MTNNHITSSSELVRSLSTGENDYPVGIDFHDGGTRGLYAAGNQVSGFRAAFRVRDGGDADSRYNEVNGLITGNTVSDCYVGLVTRFSSTAPNAAMRAISYIGNVHTRMQRYVVYLSQYSAGCLMSENILNGDFLNEAADTTVSFLQTESDCPALTFKGNKWFRTSNGNAGTTTRMASIASVVDTTTFPQAAFAGKTRLRANFIDREVTAKFTINNSTYKQEDAFSDVNGPSTAGAYGSLLSGDYTPTITSVTNVDAASVSGQFEWFRIGDRVFVTGTVSIDATAAAQFTIGISLPIASTFTVAYDCSGVGASSSGSQGRLFGDATNNRVSFTAIASGTSAQRYGVTFAYRIK